MMWIITGIRSVRLNRDIWIWFTCEEETIALNTLISFCCDTSTFGTCTNHEYLNTIPFLGFVEETIQHWDIHDLAGWFSDVSCLGLVGLFAFDSVHGG